jgi:hypothetical protein
VGGEYLARVRVEGETCYLGGSDEGVKAGGRCGVPEARTMMMIMMMESDDREVRH